TWSVAAAAPNRIPAPQAGPSPAATHATANAGTAAKRNSVSALGSRRRSAGNASGLIPKAYSCTVAARGPHAGAAGLRQRAQPHVPAGAAGARRRRRLLGLARGHARRGGAADARPRARRLRGRLRRD